MKFKVKSFENEDFQQQNMVICSQPIITVYKKTIDTK